MKERNATQSILYLIDGIFLKTALAVLKSPSGLVKSSGLEHDILIEHLHVYGKELKIPDFNKFFPLVYVF